MVQIFRVFRGQRSNTKIKTGINSHALVISHAKLLVGTEPRRLEATNISAEGSEAK